MIPLLPALSALPIPVELYHPLVVHFPLGLWITGTFLYIASLIGGLRWLRSPAIVVGVVGSLFGWLALKTGGLAADVAVKSLCNQHLLNDHAEQAETALIFFAVTWALAALFQILSGKFSGSKETPALIKLLLTFGLVMGSVFLVLAGHKGFRLVYEEGAGVRAPIHQCHE